MVQWDSTRSDLKSDGCQFETGSVSQQNIGPLQNIFFLRQSICMSVRNM